MRETAALLLHKIIKEHSLTSDSPETAFNKMLILTTCRHAVSLSALLNKFLSKKIPHKYDFAHTILLTAACELLFMESPDYAVINSYVNITKKHFGQALGGMVNAVLRNILRQKEQIKATYRQQFFPDSFKKILAKDYEAQTISKIEAATFNQPPLNISVRQDSSAWAQKLNAQIVNKQTLSLATEGKIETLEGYAEGAWWVQDTSAALAVQQFSELRGKRILDLCAAPGGKTAQLINAGAEVTSLDCSETRLQTLKQNLNRLQFKVHQIICDDILNYLENFNELPFDAVLLDAPCSATGIFRRHPEIVHLKTTADVIKQATLQKQILQKISPVLKKGGEFIYCTCSIAQAEGEEQISGFIKNNSDFKIIPLQNKEEPATITPEGFIRTLPFHYAGTGGCDAFFIAKLIKE